MRRRELLKYSALFLNALPLTLFSQAKAQAPRVSTNQKSKILSPLYLNFNENSLGPSLKVQQAIQDALKTIHRYPDEIQQTLQQSLADYFNIDKDQLCLGNGSSEIIFSAINAALYSATQKQLPIQLIVPVPTFDCAEVYANSVGIPVKKINLREDFSFDIETMQNAVDQFNGFSIVYFCNPNNPTSTITPYQKIASWLNTANTEKTLFLFDEAYAEYVTDSQFVSGISLIQQGAHNIIVSRTFSKIYALAGLRIGYAIATPYWIRLLTKFLSLDNINGIAATAANSSLHDKTYLQQSLQSIATSRDIVMQALDELNLRYLSSQANFIFHEINGNVKEYQTRMSEQQIFVGRYFSPYSSWNRLTLDTPDNMQRFVTVLKTFREKGWL